MQKKIEKNLSKIKKKKHFEKKMELRHHSLSHRPFVLFPDFSSSYDLYVIHRNHNCESLMVMSFWKWAKLAFLGN